MPAQATPRGRHEDHSPPPPGLASNFPHALADSPARLLGWNVQLMAGDAAKLARDDDFILTKLAVYRLIGTACSPVRFCPGRRQSLPAISASFRALR